VSPRLSILAVALLAGSGCITPRSMTLGQMASGVGKGATEVGVFTGVGYVSQTNPPVEVKTVAGDTLVNQDVARGFALPTAEANIAYGFSDRISFNVHGSPAGVEPGVKFTLNKSKVANVALLPALGMGYGSIGTVTLSAGPDGRITEVAPGSNTSFLFLGGLKLLVSHRSGFFFGVGYQFLFGRALHSVAGNSTVDAVTTVTVSTQHQLGASVGMDIAFGLVHLKPEIAFAVAPGVNMTWYTSVGTASPTSSAASGGFAFAFLPGFTLSVASPSKSRGDDDDVEEKHDESGNDAESDDDDAAPKKRRFRETDDAPKKRRQVEQDDDDDEKPRNKKKKSSDDDD
jgi:hypothetical protein